MTISVIQTLASAILLLLATSMSAAPLHKCVSNGAVTYQNTPCPSGDARRQPTVDELNAERKKKLASSKEKSSEPNASTSGASALPQKTTSASQPDPTGRDFEASSRKSDSLPSSSFKCDNRKYCSQMNSCAEAKYFLTNCPGVKMDGNNDGVPCEKQWCN